MKSLLSVLVTSFILQIHLSADALQDSSQPHLEIQVQKAPLNREGNHIEQRQVVPHSQTTERTLSIIKPDAVKNHHIGEIIARFENNNLHVVGLKMVKLTEDQASQFYHVHKDRPFYSDLTKFMSSGPVVLIVLEGDQAVSKNRQLMGATDPKRADQGTIRADFAESVTQNAVHGSDSVQSANEEISFFFKPNEIYFIK